MLAGLNWATTRTPIAAKLAEMAARVPGGGERRALPDQPRHGAGGHAARTATWASWPTRRPGAAHAARGSLPLLRRGAGPGQWRREQRRGQAHAHAVERHGGRRLHHGDALVQLRAGVHAGRNVAVQNSAPGLAAVALPGAHPGPACLGGAEPRRAQALLLHARASRPLWPSCARWETSGCWWCTTSRTYSVSAGPFDRAGLHARGCSSPTATCPTLSKTRERLAGEPAAREPPASGASSSWRQGGAAHALSQPEPQRLSASSRARAFSGTWLRKRSRTAGSGMSEARTRMHRTASRRARSPASVSS